MLKYHTCPRLRTLPSLRATVTPQQIVCGTHESPKIYNGIRGSMINGTL